MKLCVLTILILCVLHFGLMGMAVAQQSETPMAEATRLTRQVRTLFSEGRYDEAIPLARRMLEILEKALGPEDPLLAPVLSTLAGLYRVKDDNAQAELLYKRVLAIREKILGSEHLDIASTLNNLAGLCYKRGDFAQAEQQYKRVLAISENALGPEHPDVAKSLDNLADVYKATSDYTQAQTLYKRALAIRANAPGREDLELATSVNNLGLLYLTIGDYAQAEPLLERALAIREKAQDPLVAVSLNNLALLYQDKGDYARSEVLLNRSLAIHEKTFSPDDPILAISINNLAALRRDRGDFRQAEALNKRALAIREKVLGLSHLDVASSLNNLALLYVNKGDYGQAEPLLTRALAIHEKVLSPDHPYVATSLDNLALLYQINGDYSHAEYLSKRALDIREKVFGPSHQEFAKSLNSLALVYCERGQYNQAAPLLVRALAIDEKALGPQHPNVAGLLDNLGWVYEARGEYSRAELLHKRALSIREQALGARHPDLAISLNSLARVYMVKGDYARSANILKRQNEIEEHNLVLILATGSENRKQIYLNKLSGATDFTISLNLDFAPRDEQAARLALTAILQRKGRALDAMTDQIGFLRRHAAPRDQALLGELAVARSQLAILTISGQQQQTREARRADVARLTIEVERLEGEVSDRSAEFRFQAMPIMLDAVRPTIPADAALVEFFSYRPFNPRARTGAERFGEAHYVAYVLRHNEAVPRWAKLGKASPIDAQVEQLRAALKDPKRRDVQNYARALDKRVMQPVRELLGQTRRVFLSPDGPLNLIPFGALIDENGQYLIENYSIDYLTSGRDLLRLQDSRENSNGAVVIADPLYDLTLPSRPKGFADQANQLLTQTDTNLRSTDPTLKLYPPLPGTTEEAAALNRLLPQGVRVLLQERATEAALKQVKRPLVLHIATHGFFLPDQPHRLSLGNSPMRGTSDTLGSSFLSVRNENPLLRSGLILAGVKQQWSGINEDGVLTALETAGLDLWGTKLVVLSACETGLGDVKNGQGVYGLRRALVLAGSETQIMSLWKVSDAGTRDLMTAYYTRLQKGEGRAEAMRQVQLAMLSGQLKVGVSSGKRGTTDAAEKVATKDYRHPYYWAAFTQSGDWRSMDGK